MERVNMEKNTALASGALIGSFCAGGLSHPMDTIKVCSYFSAQGHSFFFFRLKGWIIM
jgi:patatin-like phospholipase/acyl hydrolase